MLINVHFQKPLFAFLTRSVRREEVRTMFWKGDCRKGQLGCSRLRWEDKIQIHLQEVGRGSMDWIDGLRIGTFGGRL